MNFVKSYQLVKEKGEYVLFVYLDQIDYEFANELGNLDEKKKNDFQQDIIQHIQKKFPKIYIPLCKVMMGAVIVATIPLVAGNTVKAEVVSEQMATSSYTVVSGDTLWKIAQNYKTTVDQIKTLNGLTVDSIFIGQRLTVPSTVSTLPSLYKVQAGDTLWRIASKFNLTVDALKLYNGLKSDTIYVGQELALKASAPIIKYQDYQIVSGDNLWKISLAYGIPQSELMVVNGLNESSMLKIGQIIRIPIHIVPIKETPGPMYGENLDWWTEAQYVFPINKIAKITDFQTGKTFSVKRTIGANHSDTEPLTYTDTEIAKSIWGGFSWSVRPIIVNVDGRKIAASMSFMPHGIEYIGNNNFDGHFDIHFLNSTRHNDGQIDINHQNAIKVAAGLK